MKRKIILFDFDGVIVDSFANALRVTKIMNPDMTEADYQKLFDGNINDWKKGLSEEEKRRGDEEFFEKYLPSLEQARIFPGIKEVIAKLEKTYTLLIISSTISSPIRGFIERHKMAEYFDDIMGNDVHRSKMEKIKMVYNKYGAGVDDCVFITDTLGDMREAARMGVQSIGVTWGFQRKESLLKGKPFFIAEKPEELPDIVSRYFEQK